MKLSDLYGPTGVSLLALGLAFFPFWKKKWYWLLTLVIALPGGMLINVLLKGVFLRDRPSFSDPGKPVSSVQFGNLKP
jgi:hypothetical protein